MLKITLSGAPAPANTNSSPYYDYASDTLYVGADNGTLHKFTNVFGDIFGVPPASHRLRPLPPGRLP